MGDVLPVGDQALVELTREQGDAVGSGVMAEKVAGEADLPAAAGQQLFRPQVGPGREGQGDSRCAGYGQGFSTSVLARPWWCRH
jgi:hypothetical protein